MSILLSSLGLGLVLAVLAIGLFLSFRILRFQDITVDGSFALGGSAAAAAILAGCDPCASNYWWMPELFAAECDGCGADRGHATLRTTSRPTAAA